MGQDGNSKSDTVLSESKSPDTLNITSQGINDKKPYKCTFDGCNLTFCRPSKLARHIRFHTGERNFKCDYPECDKAYTNACHLKRHAETHSPIKKTYKCSECSLYISNQHNLKRHYDTVHKKHNKLTCKVCNETFTKKYQLTSHMAVHSPDLYKCDRCDKSFTNFAKYKRHKTTHEQGQKTYPCIIPGCNEIFGQWRFYCAHLKTQHVNDHKCKDCNKVFLSKCHLKLHSQVHMENRSVISCPIEKCPRVYYFKRNLNHHIRTYHLAQKYECDICKIKIGTKQKLLDHIQKLHMIEKKVKEIKKMQRKKRKDAGLPKKSMVSKLIGIDLPLEVEKLVLGRKEDIEYINKFDTISNDKSDS